MGQTETPDRQQQEVAPAGLKVFRQHLQAQDLTAATSHRAHLPPCGYDAVLFLHSNIGIYRRDLTAMCERRGVQVRNKHSYRGIREDSGDFFMSRHRDGSRWCEGERRGRRVKGTFQAH